MISRLAIKPEELATLKGCRVLSIGEGASDFAKKLSLDHGCRAVALDWWYAMREHEMEERFVITEPTADGLREISAAEAMTRLAPMRAAALATALPIREQTCARVYLSNVVYWYFAPTRRSWLGMHDDAEGHAVINQAARCVEVGGELRFDMSSDAEADALAVVLRARFLDFSTTTDGLVVIMTRLDGIPPKPRRVRKLSV